MTELRDYQTDFVQNIRAAFRTNRRVLGVAPTGAGKTVSFAYITKNGALKGNRVTVGAHRTEICDQISVAIDQFGIRHGRIQPGHTMTDDLVQVATTPDWAKGCDILLARGAEFTRLLELADTTAKVEEIRKARGYKPFWTLKILKSRRRARAA